MAYTISTVNNAATLVGSAGVDVAVNQLAPSVTSLQVSSFEDADDFVQVDAGAFIGTVGGRIGMGANADTVTVSAVGFTDAEVLLGDGRDVATLDFVAGNRFSVKGGGGLDTINLNFQTTPGQLVDSFVNGNAGRDFINSSNRLVNTCIVGGSEDDVLTIGGAEMISGRINGQIGEDQIFVNFGTTTNATVFGGSEDDFLQNDGAGIAMSGDKGNDTLLGNGADQLFGGEDDDLLVMLGADEATGGSGVDLFDVTGVASSVATFNENPAVAADGLVSDGDFFSFGAGGAVAVITDATSSDLFQITDDLSAPAQAPDAIFGEDLGDVAGFISVVGEFTETVAGTLFTVDATGSDQLLQLNATALVSGVPIVGTDFFILTDSTSPVASQIFG